MPRYVASPDLLRGRVVLVTGASSGLGRAVAIAYAHHGAQVIVLGRSIARLEECYDAIVAENAPTPAIYPFNLASASPNDFAELAQRLEENFGRLDGLVHCAAQLGNLTPLEYYDLRQWYNVLQTNLNAPFMLTKACLGLLKKSSAASVIFTEDSPEQCGRAYWGAYGVSKFALMGLRRVLADELENYTQIRVNSLYPGKLRTSMRAKAFPGHAPEHAHDPSEALPAFLFLMGDDGRSLNGQCVHALKQGTGTQHFHSAPFNDLALDDVR